MDNDVNEAVNALLGDDSGSDWEKECCTESETSYNDQLHNIPSSNEESDSEDVPIPSNNHLEILKTHFGHSSFRPMQWKIIYSIIEKKEDNCVIMATGYGKSLCYQYPAVYSKGTTVVVSPLISLMQDQVLSLKVANISACFLGSAQSHKGEVMYKLMNGEYRVVYLTPEYITGSQGENLLTDMLQNGVSLTLVAIDEAHCVSQWGHDFRSSYRNLGKIRDKLPKVPFLAVTATATPEVRKDIVKSLHLRSPTVTCTGFDRPNLYLKACPKGSSVFDDLRPFMIKVDGHWTFKGSTIIYCPTKKKTSSVSDSLKELGVECEEYHAGLKLEIRKKAHEDFVKDKIKVIVATVAFGMGIDKPDVRLIIHYGVPQDIESYYQEIGRAGRDGLPASCLVFFAASDFTLNRHFISTIRSAQFRKHKEEMSNLLESYLETSECRRRLLLSHFKDNKMNNAEAGILSSTCCDNCTRKLAMKNAGIMEQETAGLDSLGRYDFSEDSRLVLGAVDALGGHFGLGIPILFLRGSKSNKLNDKLMKDPLYGKGKDKTEEYWKNLGRLLLREGYLEENDKNAFKRNFSKKHFPVATIRVSGQGKKFLSSWSVNTNADSKLRKPSILLVPPSKLLELIKKTRRETLRSSGGAHMLLPSLTRDALLTSSNYVHMPPSMSGEETSLQHKLFGELVQLRNVLALENNCMPYMVASDKSLLDMTKLRPSKSESLMRVDGFNEARINKFGGTLIDKLVFFCQKNGLKLDNFEEGEYPTSFAQPRGDGSVEDNEIMASLTETTKLTYIAFQIKKNSIEEVEKLRGLKESTLRGHLADAIKLGLNVDLARLGFTRTTLKIIEEIVHTSPGKLDVTNVGQIKSHCPAQITWGDVRVAAAILLLKMKMGHSDTFEKKLKELFGTDEFPTDKKTNEILRVDISKFAFSKSSTLNQQNPLCRDSTEADSKWSGESSIADKTMTQPKKGFLNLTTASSEKITGSSLTVKEKLSCFRAQTSPCVSKIKYVDDEIGDVPCTSGRLQRSVVQDEILASSPASKFAFKRPSFLISPTQEKSSCFSREGHEMQVANTKACEVSESRCREKSCDSMLKEDINRLETDDLTEFSAERVSGYLSRGYQNFSSKVKDTEKVDHSSPEFKEMETSVSTKVIEDAGNKRKMSAWLEAKKEMKKRKTKLANL